MPKKPGLIRRETYVPWTEEELDRLSEITPDDIEQAKALVKRSSPLAAKLLDAKLDEGEDAGIERTV